jgi:thiol-disulfide isomerase/thioredoxin
METALCGAGKCASRMGLVFAFLVAGANVLGATEEPSVALPSNAGNWINSSPITLPTLAGKGAVVYFFEEECPRCRARWPELMALSKKYEDQPVAFVAVNSGTDRAALMNYAKQNKVGWPIIVDGSRELERAAGVNEISLSNIFQVRVIRPDGKMIPARWDDLDGAVQLALKGAAWKNDPTDIPESMRPASRALEFGNYAAAGPLIVKGRSSPDAATKKGAEKLMGIVQPKIDADLAAAKASMAAGDKWTALNKYSDLAQQFQGFTLPPEAITQRNALINDSQVKAIKKASNDLEGVQHLLAVTPTLDDIQRKRVGPMLKQIAKDAAGTEYAKQAQELSAKLGFATN